MPSDDDEPRNLPEDFLRKRPETPPEPGYGQPGQGQGQPSYGQPSYGQPGHPPSAPTPYGYGQAPQQQPYPQAQWPGQWQMEPPKHPKASTAMILGIVGLAGSPFSCGLSLVVSPIAWAMGARAGKEIAAAPTQFSGASDANTGKITGLIGTVLLVLAVLLVIAFFGLAIFSASEISQVDNGYDSGTVPGSSSRM